jgi:hypothetical protein
MHERFNRIVLASKKDFTGALAKWLVKQSPYTVPKHLDVIIEKFDKELEKTFHFSELGFTNLDLSKSTLIFNSILEKIEEMNILNTPVNGNIDHLVISMCTGDINPDDDFIDILAVAQNITVEFATEADSDELWKS